MPAALVSADEIDRQLHDAWIDLSSIEKPDGELVLHGIVERPLEHGAALPRLGRFAFSLSFRNVTRVIVDDPEEISSLLVGNVTYTEAGAFLFEGPIPGRVLAYTTEAHAELEFSPDPLEIRRWFRWRSRQRHR